MQKTSAPSEHAAPKRKLAAILSADVVGYSRLMGDDEQATLATLTAYRKIFADHIIAHAGRVVDSPGDALLAEFPSAVEAVNCAVDIQSELAGRNASLPEHRRMRFRIGINLGDVAEKDGALYGDGVNIAARLESLAEAGGICVSGTVYDHVEGKLPVSFKFVGEQSVKNIAKPVRVYRALLGFNNDGSLVSRGKRANWRAPVIATVVGILAAIGAGGWYVYEHNYRIARKQDAALAIPNGPAVAVLPLQNMSDDPGQEYFAEGITEEIITGLSRFPNLRVPAGNTTFQYKGQSKDVRDIGREIHADYVVAGSVRKAGDSVRVTVQLLDLVVYPLSAESLLS